MGMFDWVHFEMDCPLCGSKITGFQSKDGKCDLMTIEPDDVEDFYSSCKCGAWVQFSKEQEIIPKPREKSLTKEEVESMGFVMAVYNNESK